MQISSKVSAIQLNADSEKLVVDVAAAIGKLTVSDSNAKIEVATTLIINKVEAEGAIENIIKNYDQIKDNIKEIIQGGESNPSPNPTDQEAPVIKINGKTKLSVENGAPLVLPVVTATDNKDQIVKVTSIIRNAAGQVLQQIDTKVAGTYTITYSAVDTAGNKAKDLVVKVIVAQVIGDQTPPTAEEIKVLTDALREAQDKATSAVAGTEPGQYPQEAIEALTQAIVTADAVAKKQNVTKVEVNQAVADLATAVSTFEKAIVPAPPTIDYTAEGEVTAISSDKVTYEGGKFIVAADADITEFTFKDGDKEMEAKLVEGNWAITVNKAEEDALTAEYTGVPAETTINVANGGTVELPTITATIDGEGAEVSTVIKNAANEEIKNIDTAVAGTYTVTYTAAGAENSVVITVVVAEALVTYTVKEGANAKEIVLTFSESVGLVGNLESVDGTVTDATAAISGEGLVLTISSTNGAIEGQTVIVPLIINNKEVVTTFTFDGTAWTIADSINRFKEVNSLLSHLEKDGELTQSAEGVYSATFKWGSSLGIGTENEKVSGSSGGYNYYTDGAYLRFQVKQDEVVKKFSEVFTTVNDGNNTNGGMTLQTNSGNVNDMDGSLRELADWNATNTGSTNLFNLVGSYYVFYGVIQNNEDGTKTVGFTPNDLRNITMTLQPKEQLEIGTYSLTIEVVQQGKEDKGILDRITYTFTK